MGYRVPVVVVALAVATIALLAATSVESFFLPTAVPVVALRRGAGRTGLGAGTLRMKYVPDGLSPEEWKKMQAKEAAKKKKLDLGYVGVKGFKSRSLQAWQEAGSGHLFPVNPKKVKTGEIPQEKTPYMQRGGGAWDDSDLAKKQLKSKEGKKITKKQWSDTDKAYAAGGYKKELSSSIFPTDPLQWSASKSPGGGKKGAADAQKKAGKPGSKAAAVKGQGDKKRPGNDAARKKKAEEEAKLKGQLKSEGKKGLFGLW